MRRILTILFIISLLLLSSCGGNKEDVVPYTDIATPTHSVDMITTKGKVRFVLFEEEMPKTTKHFKDVIDRGTYTGLTFFRVIPRKLIQTGDPNNDGSGDIGVFVKLETNPKLIHIPYTVGMAHPVGKEDRASSQFYITLDESPNLDGKYAVLGMVVQGQDIVDEISNGDIIISVSVNDATEADLLAMEDIFEKNSKRAENRQRNSNVRQAED